MLGLGSNTIYLFQPTTLRYGMFAGPVTLNDVLTVAPYNDSLHVIAGLNATALGLVGAAFPALTLVDLTLAPMQHLQNNNRNSSHSLQYSLIVTGFYARQVSLSLSLCLCVCLCMFVRALFGCL